MDGTLCPTCNKPGTKVERIYSFTDGTPQRFRASNEMERSKNLAAQEWAHNRPNKSNPGGISDAEAVKKGYLAPKAKGSY